MFFVLGPQSVVCFVQVYSDRPSLNMATVSVWGPNVKLRPVPQGINENEHQNKNKRKGLIFNQGQEAPCFNPLHWVIVCLEISMIN